MAGTLHETVQDRLILLRDDGLDDASRVETIEHLRECVECQRVWHDIQAFNSTLRARELATAISVPSGMHVDEQHLWRLADSDATLASVDTDVQLWGHILYCGECFAKLLDCAEALHSTSDVNVPDATASAEAVWDALEARRIGVTLLWTAVALRITSRRSNWLRAARVRGTSDDASSVVGVNEKWSLRTQIAAYTVSLNIVPTDVDERLFEVSVDVEGPNPEHLRIRIWRGSELISNFEPVEGTLSLPRLAAGRYRLDFIEMRNELGEGREERIGSIEIGDS